MQVLGVIDFIYQEEKVVRRAVALVCGVVGMMSVVCASASEGSLEQSVGFGLGLPYGGVGVNYELGVNDYFAPTLGVGLLPDNLGWNLGVRLYYPGRDSKLRGRLTALYGTNTLIEYTGYGESDYKTKEGFSAGIGANWRFSKTWAFDADLFVAESKAPAGAEKKGGDVKFSLGMSRRW